MIILVRLDDSKMEENPLLQPSTLLQVAKHPFIRVCKPLKRCVYLHSPQLYSHLESEKLHKIVELLLPWHNEVNIGRNPQLSMFLSTGCYLPLLNKAQK